jgi:hypothetical protein
MTQQPNHSILGGKVQLYRRGNSSYWWCAASFGGKQRRSSTKEENLALARTVAEDWYLEIRGKSRAGLLKTEKTFGQAADQFTRNTESSPRASAASAGSRATKSASACI